MKYFVKLHTKLLDSAVWQESPIVRVVFLTLLLKANSDGIVSACVRALINAAVVREDEFSDAVEKLKELQTIEDSDCGGITVVNYAKYKARSVTGDPSSPGAERTRKWRERKELEVAKTPASKKERASPTSQNVTSLSLSNRNKKRWRIVPADWEPNDKHVTLAKGRGVDFGLELEKFRDWEFKDPKSDADRAFSNWLRRALPTKSVQTRDDEWNN